MTNSNGVLTNAAGGVINGSVVVAHLTNYGYIATATAQGVNKASGTIGYLNAYPNGSFTNLGLVSHGVGGGFLTFTNVGTILAGVNNYDGLLDNRGNISGGISGDGRTITNEAGGVISGNIQMKGFIGDQTLTNAGTIIGNVVSTGEAIGYSAATVANTGTIEGVVEGVKILTNAANGVITGGIIDGPIPLYTATNAGFIGGTATLNGGDLLVNQTGGTLGSVLLQGADATLVQAGTILGGVTLSGNNDYVALSPTAVTYGALVGSNNDSATLELQAGSGTLSSVVNFGTIIFDPGANWVIGTAVTFTAHPQLGVRGTLIGATSLDVAGLLSNYQTLTQTITVQSGATLTNAGVGRLLGSVSDAGLVTNAGYISALNLTGSRVTNFSGGTIASALIEADANDTVSNAGTLLQGVTLTGAGAALSNTGTILGGVTASGSGETISNGGSIAGAVSIAGSDNVLLLYPGTRLGGGATGNSSATLIFGSGSGTLSSLHSSVTGFGTYTALAGAAWSLAGSTDITGSFALGGPGSLSVTGSLDNTGTISGNVEVGAGGTLVNHAGAVIANGLSDAGTLVDAGSIAGVVTLTSNAMLSLASDGTVAGITGSTNGIKLALAGTVTGAVNLSGSGDTVSLNSGYAVGSSTIAAANTIALTSGGGTLTGGVPLLGHYVQLQGGATWQDNENGSSAGGLTVGGSSGLVSTGNVSLSGGVSVAPGASFTNAGTETGTIHVAAGAATIVDVGTIIGGVSLAGGGDVLALAPGATINGAISAGAGAVLELQAGMGTLHSLYGFTTLVADAGANWTLDIPTVTGGLTLQGTGTFNSTELSGSGSLTNSATLNAGVDLGAVENYGVILGAVTSAGRVDNRGSIGASVTLTGSAGIYNHLDDVISGALNATGDGETIINWGIINGPVSLSGHDDEVELIGPGTYAGGSFVGGVTGAADGSSSLYLSAQNLDLNSLTLANLANYTNVPSLRVAGGVTLTIQTLDRNETFSGPGELYVPSIVAGTLTNAGYMLSGVVLTGTGALVNLPGATLAAYVSADPTAGTVIKNFTSGSQTITNLGAMGGVSLGAGGVLALGSTGTFTQNVYAYHTGTDFYLGGVYNGTLRLLAGSGAISGFGDSQFERYVPVYAFNNFNTIDVAAGGMWALDGDPRIANSLTISGAGTLNLSQSLTVEHGLYRNYNNFVDFEPQYFEYGRLTVTGRLTNSGVLQGNVALSGTGGFINLAGGNLAGGIDVTGAGQTVGNLGAMANGVALYGGDRLIIGANATFGGAISGGTGGNTLEIASGPFTLSNFNAPGYAQFSELQIDAGVNVTLNASDTLAGIALVNYGTLNLSAGFTAQSTLTNGGMLTGDVTLASGVPITNVAGGTISGNGLAVIESQGGPASVLNGGIIDPATYGVYLPAGGTVTNVAGGTIEGTAIGVLIKGGTGTVINAGTIPGDGGTAVSLAASYANRVILDPGAAFNDGIVDGGNTIGATAASTLELASGTGTGTLSGLGSDYVNFASVVIDNGAAWRLTGSNTLAAGGTITNAGTLTLANATLIDTGTLVNNGGIVLDPGTMFVGSLLGTGDITLQANATLEVGGTIASGETIVFDGAGATLKLDQPGSVSGTVTGFALGDTIDLVGIAPDAITYLSGALGSTPPGGGPSQFPLALAAGNTLQPPATDGNGGTDLTTLCFVAGTLIGTPKGYVLVEALAVGDTVTLWGGGTRPITWIGRGRVLATRGRRSSATPVIVRKGALADNVPLRDLHVTKGHSLFIDDVLIPVEFLINHRSIEWDDRAQEVTPYHVELDAHDVMVANGAPAESYRDDGNRWLFRNYNDAWDLPPREPCAPILTGGGKVDAIWRRLLDRAGPRPGLPLTDAPDLHLLVDGRRVEAASCVNGDYIFELRGKPVSVRVVSRSAVPAELGLARDPRELGVALTQIVVRQNMQLRVTEASDPLLETAMQHGFHGFEPGLGLRWTNGDSMLPEAILEACDGPFELMLRVGCTSQYELSEDTPAAPARTRRPLRRHYQF